MSDTSPPYGGSAPPTGSANPAETELSPEEEPVVTGTLFLVMIILMIIGAVWVIMYMRLLQ
jgi:flagellar biogenesis protein FliO